MGWNHRVCKRTYRKGDPDEETYYEIHECFYDADEPPNGKPWGIGERSRLGTGPDDKDRIPPNAENVDDLRELLHMMLRSLDQPVLDFETREQVPE